VIADAVAWGLTVALALAAGAAVIASWNGARALAARFDRNRKQRQALGLDELELNPQAPTAGEEGRSRPIKWAFVMNWGQQLAATISTFVIAAIVGPRSYGIVAIAAVYIALIQLALDQGISIAIIQRKELEPEHLDSAFWMNLAWSGILVAVSVGVAGWWADINHTQQLEPVIKVLSISIPITALTIVQQSLLQRQLDFKRLAIRSNVAAFFGGVLGIVLAIAGYGVWALVGQTLGVAGMSLVLLWAVGRWTPHFRFSGRHAKELLGFSWQVFMGNLGTFVNRRIDALLMGVFFGPVAVGLYRLADRLVEALVTLGARPMQSYAIASLSRLQDDPEKLRGSVRFCMHLSFLATVPLMLGTVACSNEIVNLLGPNWQAAGTVLKLLAIVGVVKALMLFTGSVLFAVSKPHLRAFMIWTGAALSAIAFAAVAVALQDKVVHTQITGMAISRVVLFVFILMPLSLGIVAKMTGLTFRSILPTLPAPLAAGVTSIVAVGILRMAGLDDLAPALALFIALVVTIVSQAAVLIALEPGIRERALRLVGRPKPRGATPPRASVESRT
jgi:O-antigen/teichoic acid export membrane protein